MTEKRAPVSREVWARRIEQWKDSGLTAPAFARELGINPGTLTYWQHRLKKVSNRAKGTKAQTMISTKLAKLPKSPARATFVRIDAPPRTDERFLLELPAGRRLHIPAGFDAAALRRLMSVLEGA